MKRVAITVFAVGAALLAAGSAHADNPLGVPPPFQSPYCNSICAGGNIGRMVEIFSGYRALRALTAMGPALQHERRGIVRDLIAPRPSAPSRAVTGGRVSEPASAGSAAFARLGLRAR